MSIWLWPSPIRFLRSIVFCGIWRRRRNSNRQRLRASPFTTNCACSTAKLVAGRGIQELRLPPTRLWLCLTATFRLHHYRVEDIIWYATIPIIKEVNSSNFIFFLFHFLSTFTLLLSNKVAIVRRVHAMMQGMVSQPRDDEWQIGLLLCWADSTLIIMNFVRGAVGRIRLFFRRSFSPWRRSISPIHWGIQPLHTKHTYTQKNRTEY